MPRFRHPRRAGSSGHEGVILHTADGGKTWTRQLDGVQLAKIGLDHYGARLGQEPDNERYAFLVDEMKLAHEGNADRPFFKIAMHSASAGFAAGAYGLLFATVDGGKSWVPEMERMDLEQFVHLFDYARLPPATTDNPGPGAVELVVAGEMGTILAQDPATGNWQPRDFPYEGSMFTILATRSGALVTGGLRGLVFRSTDRGASWTEVEKPATVAIVLEHRSCRTGASSSPCRTGHCSPAATMEPLSHRSRSRIRSRSATSSRGGPESWCSAGPSVCAWSRCPGRIRRNPRVVPSQYK